MSVSTGWLQRRMLQYKAFLQGFWVGERRWGFIRLLVVGFILLFFFLFAAVLWEQETIRYTLLRWRYSSSIMGLLPEFTHTPLAPFLTLASLRYLIIPLAAVTGAMLVGARYVQDIYELNSYTLALQYLFASMFGILYPRLIISEGQKKVKPGDENLLDRIGGPGYVIIRPGNVVLFERLNNPSSVRAGGFHFISRFETIKEIANLEDQHGYIEKMQAVTKDGVVVRARDIHYSYRLWSPRRLGGATGRSKETPYPYSVQAVRNMAYRRVVDNDGLISWPKTVQKVFDSQISDYIRRHNVDQVTAPRSVDSDPRAEIHQLYRSSKFRDAFRGIGAQLLWYGIGHFEVDNSTVNDQRVATWQAGWRGDATVIRAYSEAVSESYREQGRAEGQAEILLSIIHTLNDIGAASQSDTQHVQDIFLLRFAQLLEAMREECKGEESRE